MNDLHKLVSDQMGDMAADSPAAGKLARQFGSLTGGEVYAESIAARHGVAFFMLRKGLEKRLVLVWSAAASPTIQADFDGEQLTGHIDGADVAGKICLTNAANADALRRHIRWTGPSLIGLTKSVGLGDRLGLATPGHVRAVMGTDVAPVFAQQSIRELARTERTPQDVIDAATWGVFQAGWRHPSGADADHLKTIEDIEATLPAGFCMFTIDPSDHVDNGADTDDAGRLVEKFEALPWNELECASSDWMNTYAGKTFTLPGGMVLCFDREDVLRAGVKYGSAVAHVCKLARHLALRAGDRFELEMSVDETTTPTSLLEHYFVANELKRLGVRCVSLAPRFVGEFEKGVDYKGDLHRFERQLIGHVAIARHLGPYKISIHSGSDKFSIYPIAAEHAGDLVHVKTAGTSYLEALRVAATKAPGLFREVLDFARDRFDTDKATYHISADLARVPVGEAIHDGDLPKLLDQHDARQVLHVTFGSVLTWRRDDGGWLLRDRLLTMLMEHEQTYCQMLAEHLGRHVAPFAGL
ncbi:MAG TPA: tagaturonate epimerase family protein [Phycisphaerae bacterium]|nr:tagaturonate epimerase family protein [Phycisphaerae bacterium]